MGRCFDRKWSDSLVVSHYKSHSDILRIIILAEARRLNAFVDAILVEPVIRVECNRFDDNVDLHNHYQYSQQFEEYFLISGGEQNCPDALHEAAENGVDRMAEPVLFEHVIGGGIIIGFAHGHESIEVFVNAKMLKRVLEIYERTVFA